MINKAIILGNVGKDPEVRTTNQGTKVANFSMATSEKYKDKETTEWHNIVAFGGVVDVIEKYVKKGSRIYIEGKISTSQYETDSGTKYKTEIIVRELKLLS